MTLIQKVQQQVLNTLIFLLFGATLTQSKLFVSPFAFSYYGYHIVASTLIILAGIVLLLYKSYLQMRLLPVAFFALYVLYGIVQNFGSFNFGHIFFMINGLAFGSYMVFFATKSIKIGTIGKILSFFVLVESVLCLAQYFDWVATRGKLFEVYGSLPNPNYTAMFLVMALPTQLLMVYRERRFFRYIGILSILLMSIALVLLQCRTAVIGAIVGTSYFLFYQYDGIEKLRNFIKISSKLKLSLIISSLFVAIGFAISYLYAFKQGSSEGRLLIWKIAVNMGFQKPVFGHGVYSFSKYYNLAQADYFQSGKGSTAEVFSAAYVSVPYNDYLLSFIEDGLIGFLLFAGFLVSLLMFSFTKACQSITYRTAYAGVLIFAVMSLFNSQMYVTPVFALFMLYAAILCVSEEVNSTINPFTKCVLVLSFTSLGLYFLTSQYDMAKASHKIKKATIALKKDKPDKAIDLLEQSSKILSFSDQLWWNYATALEASNDYEGALAKYQIAERYTSDPELFMDMSFCYSKLHRFDEAMQKCSIALYIAPNRIQPRYVLMNIFLEKKDTINAEKVAREILAQTPKGISKDAPFYKEEARKVLGNH